MGKWMTCGPVLIRFHQVAQQIRRSPLDWAVQCLHHNLASLWLSSCLTTVCNQHANEAFLAVPSAMGDRIHQASSGFTRLITTTTLRMGIACCQTQVKIYCMSQRLIWIKTENRFLTFLSFHEGHVTTGRETFYAHHLVLVLFK